MPLSLVLQLESLSSGRIDQFTGRGVHGFWFQRWREVDPATGDRLHQESQESPFTLSPLMGLPRPRKDGLPIQPGQSAWLRITCLSADLAQAVQAKWLDGLQSGPPIPA